MLKKLFSLFAALTLSAGLWAEGSVFTYTATVKLESQFAGLGTVATHEFNAGNGRVTYDGTVTVIGASAFNACSALLSITIPEGVTTIGEKAFAVCFSLQSVTIPASVTTIDQEAFRVCGALASVTFLGNACQNAIGEAAFYGVGEDAPALLTLPNSWTGTKPDEDGNWYGGKFELSEEPAPVVGDQFVDATYGLKFEVTAVGEADTVKVIANSYTGTAYEIPATVSYNDVTFAVTEIGEKAFFGCSALQSVTIPASVTTIGGLAFSSCTALTSVTFLGNACQEGIAATAFMMVGYTTPVLLTLPDNWGDNRPANNHNTWHGGLFEYEVPVLGDQFVDATYGLKFEVTAVGEANTVKVVDNRYKGTSYTVPATVKHKEVDFAVTEIGNSAFFNSSNLTSVTLSEGLTTIGQYAFKGCSKLTSITLPASVTTIGSKAFSPCSALTSVTFADGSQLTTIGVEAFNTCSNLQTVTLPAALKSIGASAFQGCSKLTPIVFPASLDTIGESAFYGCSALESITIPASVDTIGRSAFRGCKGLTSIVVEAGNTKYDSRDNCNGLVETANNTLIAACQNTIIPNTVTCLVPAVFQSQPITTITIPASVTSIGSQAFGNCSALTSVTFLGNACQESIANDAFGNVGKTDPALLTLPNSWTGTLPDEDGNWYGGKFELLNDPTALPTLFGDGVKGNKFFRNGQLIIRKDGKNYNAAGAEVK